MDCDVSTIFDVKRAAFQLFLQDMRFIVEKWKTPFNDM